MPGSAPSPPAGCPSCGARVDAAPRDEAFVYTCRFCGTHTTIEPDARAAKRRRDELAAAQSRAHAQAAHAQVQATARASRSLGWVIAIGTLLPLCIPVAIFVVPLVKGLVAGRFGGFPIAVGLNESVEIVDRTATSEDTLIDVGVNGKVTLRRCHLKGPMIVKASVNAQITVIDSTLEGARGVFDVDQPNVVISIQNSTVTSGEEILDEGASNVKLAITKDSKLTAEGTAIPAAMNAEVAVDHSSVEGKSGGIEIKGNAKVKLTNGAVVKSDGTAIDVGTNGQLTVSSSRVESKTIAVHATANLEATLRSASLVGPKGALDTGTNARVTASASTFSGPKLVPKGSSIEER